MQEFKIIDKYITKQLVETFLIGIVIFTSIMFASDTFITLVKQIATYGIPFKVAILVIILKLPTMLVYTIPMGVLLSTVMTINKMSTSFEVTAMRACGISIDRIAKPVVIFGLIATLSSFIINEAIVPAANAQAKTLTMWALSQKNIPSGKKNFSLKEMKGPVLKRMFYIASTENKTLKGVTVLDLSKPKTIQVIQSKHGKTSPEYWSFNKGVIYTISTTGKVLNTTLFDTLKLNNSINIIDRLKKHKEREMNFVSLSKYIIDNNKKLKNIKKVDAAVEYMKSELTKLSIALHEKFALPVTAFILGLIGLPLAITPPRVRFNRGFLFSILIIFCYYLIRAFSLSLGEAHIITPFISAWLPNIILGAAGGYLLYKKVYHI